MQAFGTVLSCLDILIAPIGGWSNRGCEGYKITNQLSMETGYCQVKINVFWLPLCCGRKELTSGLILAYTTVQSEHTDLILL